VNVVEQIRAAIERIGWSETARRSGVNRVTLHRCFGKNGREHPTMTTIERVLPHIGLRIAVEEVQ
jgi:DNA-binding phage protein